MIFRKLKQAIKSQRGFTLVEIIVVVAISGIIGLGATMSTVQVLNQSARNSDYTTASRNTMNAIYWISRDAQMSQTLSPGGTTGFPLTLSWTEWDTSSHQVIYSIEEGMLRRIYSIDGGEPTQTVVALYVNSIAENTTCEYAGGVLTVKVTSTVGEGTHAVSVSKVREISPRPGL